MKNIMWLIQITCLSLMFSLRAAADVAIIVHPSNDAHISTKSIVNIFLGKTRVFSNGEQAIPLAFETNTKEMKEFVRVVIKKTPGQYQSYWSRLIFSGAGVPPRVIYSNEEIIRLVSRNPNLIGIVDVGSLTNSVRMVLLSSDVN